VAQKRGCFADYDGGDDDKDIRKPISNNKIIFK
jgi:hypothetical protein